MVRPSNQKSAQRILKQFFTNTTIHAFNFFTMEEISLYEKIFWALVNIVTITITILWIQFLWVWYAEESTFVNFDGAIPLEEVEHPGIAICNVNKISRRQAFEFAKEINSFIKQKNVTALMEDIKLIGNLYDFNMNGQERFQKVQEILDKYDNKTSFYDPTARIIELSTPCNDILQYCRWDNVEYPCNELFLTRMTFDGPCCVFNYVRPSERKHLYANINTQEAPTEPKTCDGPGKIHGLEVVLKNDLDDYFYTTMETTGFLLHLFMCQDFPDQLSGSLKEFLVDVGQEISLSIDVDVIRSTPQVKSIPYRLRNCKFENEANTSFGVYRQSDCFVECKLRSMKALCNCIPFVMPIEPKSSKYRSVCSLIDIPCVNQYSLTHTSKIILWLPILGRDRDVKLLLNEFVGKWSRYFPIGTKIEALELEQHDSLHCDCPATCNSLNYRVYTNSFPFENRNLSKINIYFIKGFGNLYVIDLTLTWFEVLSAYGGLMSLVMGLSLISVIEVLILFCKLILYVAHKLLFSFK